MAKSNPESKVYFSLCTLLWHHIVSHLITTMFTCLFAELSLAERTLLLNEGESAQLCLDLINSNMIVGTATVTLVTQDSENTIGIFLSSLSLSLSLLIPPFLSFSVSLFLSCKLHPSHPLYLFPFHLLVCTFEMSICRWCRLYFYKPSISIFSNGRGQTMYYNSDYTR